MAKKPVPAFIEKKIEAAKDKKPGKKAMPAAKKAGGKKGKAC